MSADVSANIQYIQTLFMGILDRMEAHPDWRTSIPILEAEPPQFRSIAYESASMDIGLRDLLKHKLLQQWITFREQAGRLHRFHIDIGLGWAFAKIKMKYEPEWAEFQACLPENFWMIWDGIGYYDALFRGRKTIKHQQLPPGIDAIQARAYHQGIGRRLWYMSKGTLSELTHLFHRFEEKRFADLWRGVGIACGYVGGYHVTDLQALVVASDKYRAHLQTGIALAAMSRLVADCPTPDLATACELICQKSLDEMEQVGPFLTMLNPGSSINYHKHLLLLERSFA